MPTPKLRLTWLAPASALIVNPAASRSAPSSVRTTDRGLTVVSLSAGTMIKAPVSHIKLVKLGGATADDAARLLIALLSATIPHV